MCSQQATKFDIRYRLLGLRRYDTLCLGQQRPHNHRHGCSPVQLYRSLSDGLNAEYFRSNVARSPVTKRADNP